MGQRAHFVLKIRRAGRGDDKCLAGHLDVLGVGDQIVAQRLLSWAEGVVGEAMDDLHLGPLFQQPGHTAGVPVGGGTVKEAARVFVDAQRQESGLNRRHIRCLHHQLFHQQCCVGPGGERTQRAVPPAPAIGKGVRVGVVVDEQKFCRLVHPFDSVESAGVHQNGPLHLAPGHPFRFDKGKGGAIERQKALAVAVDCAGQHRNCAGEEQCCAEEGGQGVEIRVFVGQDDSVIGHKSRIECG